MNIHPFFPLFFLYCHSSLLSFKSSHFSLFFYQIFGIHGNVQSAEREPCYEGLIGIALYLDRDPLGGQKEHSHILYWSLSLDEEMNLPHQLGYLLPTRDIG